MNIYDSIYWDDDRSVGEKLAEAIMGRGGQDLMWDMEVEAVVTKELNYKLYTKLFLGMAEVLINVPNFSKVESLWGLVSV